MAADNGYYTYIALAGDTFDSISLDFYNQEAQSPVIIEANPNYRKTILFKGGESLKVPIIPSTSAAASLPPWKRGTSK